MSTHRGSLRIYLGVVSGEAMRSALLAEGRRRASTGGRVVAAVREPSDDLAVGGMVVVGLPQESGWLAEVLASKPDLLLVDDVAQPSGAPASQRWAAIERVRDEGVDVATTFAITDLASMSDVALRVGADPARVQVPDRMAEDATEVEFVDLWPNQVRGTPDSTGSPAPLPSPSSVVGPDPQPPVLRELALYWLAARGGGPGPTSGAAEGETVRRERVLVAVTGAPSNDQVVVRAARLARRIGGELVGVHVRTKAEAPIAEHALLANRRLLERLGGRYIEVAGGDPAGALLDLSAAEQATQLVIGASRRSWVHAALHGSIVQRLARDLHGADLHILSVPDAGEPVVLQPAGRVGLGLRRRVAGVVVAVLGLVLVTFLGIAGSPEGHAGPLLGYLLVVALASALGGVWPGVTCAVVAFLLGNWYFTPPIGTWEIGQVEDLVVLVVFVTVGSLIAWLVSANARRSAEASRARAEAETLARSSAALVGEADPIRSLVHLVRNVFGLDAVVVLERRGDRWNVIDSVGTTPPVDPSQGQAVEMGLGRKLVMTGPSLAAEDHRLLGVFAAEINAAIEGRALQERANKAKALEEANRLRAALLQSVSHDLRTPLTSIKACVTTLLHGDLHLDADQQHEMLVTVDQESDRLNRVVGNLLDASRLHAGALRPNLRRVDVEDDVLIPAVTALGLDRGTVEVHLPEVLPLVMADPGLLEQALVNLLANAVSWSPSGEPVRVESAVGDGVLVLSVVDHGPGIDEARREHVFEPFQRLGDRSSQAGVGLGLSVAEGFVSTMGGSLHLEETPGGGATFTVTLPVAASDDAFGEVPAVAGGEDP